MNVCWRTFGEIAGITKSHHFVNSSFIYSVPTPEGATSGRLAFLSFKISSVTASLPHPDTNSWKNIPSTAMDQHQRHLTLPQQSWSTGQAPQNLLGSQPRTGAAAALSPEAAIWKQHPPNTPKIPLRKPQTTNNQTKTNKNPQTIPPKQQKTPKTYKKTTHKNNSTKKQIKKKTHQKKPTKSNPNSFQMYFIADTDALFPEFL